MQAARGTGLIEQLPPVEPPPRAAGSLQWAGLLAVVAAAVAADQLTKRLIVRELSLGETHRVVPGVDITHLRNTGIAFGIFPGHFYDVIRSGVDPLVTRITAVVPLAEQTREELGVRSEAKVSGDLSRSLLPSDNPSPLTPTRLSSSQAHASRGSE